jgi:C-terminal processing protease CtpA/Prc
MGEKRSPVWNNFGCALQPNGEVLEVGQLVYPSPAVESGLTLGDTVLIVNGRPVDATDFCEVRRLFGEPAPIKMTIQRIGTEIQTVLRRRDLFSNGQ